MATPDDRGSSFVEIVAAVTVLALIAVPLLNGLMTSMRASQQRQVDAEMDTALIDVADRIDRSPHACDYRAVLDAAAVAQGWPTSAIDATYEHRPRLTTGGLGTWQPGACATDTVFAQRLTVTVRAPGSTRGTSIQIVKTDV